MPIQCMDDFKPSILLSQISNAKVLCRPPSFALQPLQQTGPGKGSMFVFLASHSQDGLSTKVPVSSWSSIELQVKESIFAIHVEVLR